MPAKNIPWSQRQRCTISGSRSTGILATSIALGTSLMALSASLMQTIAVGNHAHADECCESNLLRLFCCDYLARVARSQTA